MSSSDQSGSTHRHGHRHAHHHHGHHPHQPGDYGRAFAVGVTLNVAFVAVEGAFGFYAGSLALLADAGHNLSDVLGLLLAWGAMLLSQRRPTARHTYGLRRSSILAALANALLLLLAVGAIAWESVRRFLEPAPTAGSVVMLVAGIGIVINGATAVMFATGRKQDVNIEGAFLHMAADAAVSVGVLCGGAIIAATAWSWVDPTLSLLIVAAVTYSTWDLLRKSLGLAMDAVPHHIDPSEVRAYLASLPGVTAVHDLHIWAMSTTETALTAHLVRPLPAATGAGNAAAGTGPGNGGDDHLLAQAAHELHDHFNIGHVTLQVECGDGPHPCRLASDEAV